jgi:hypothetical protein
VAVVPKALAFQKALVEPEKLAAEMVRVERMLRPEVVRIKHTVANDATGDAALYLRVLLSDEASKPERLREVTTRIRCDPPAPRAPQFLGTYLLPSVSQSIRTSGPSGSSVDVTDGVPRRPVGTGASRFIIVHD